MGHLLGTENPDAAARLQAEGDAQFPPLSLPEPPRDEKPPHEPMPADDLMPEDRPEPTAPERAAQPPLRIGEPVVFHTRPGNGRRGRMEFAALVSRLYPESPEMVDLVVFFDAEDRVDEERVTESVGGERGWTRVLPAGYGEAMLPLLRDPTPQEIDHAGAEPEAEPMVGYLSRAQIKEVKAIAAAEVAQLLGDQYEAPPEGLLTVFAEFDERLEKIEKTKPAAAPKPAKPKKPKKTAKPKPATPPAEPKPE